MKFNPNDYPFPPDTVVAVGVETKRLHHVGRLAWAISMFEQALPHSPDEFATSFLSRFAGEDTASVNNWPEGMRVACLEALLEEGNHLPSLTLSFPDAATSFTESWSKRAEPCWRLCAKWTARADKAKAAFATLEKIGYKFASAMISDDYSAELANTGGNRPPQAFTKELVWWTRQDGYTTQLLSYLDMS